MIPDNIGNSPRPACIGIASNTDSEGEYSFLGRCIPDIHAYKQDQVADFSHRACEGELGPKGTGNTGLTTVAPVEMPGRIDGSCRRGSFNEDESALIFELAAK